MPRKRPVAFAGQSTAHQRASAARPEGTAFPGPRSVSPALGLPFAYLAVTYAWVKKRVDHIDHEVREDNEHGHHQKNAMHGYIFALRNAFDEHQAQPGQAEYSLEDDGSADEDRDLDANQAEHRDERVLNRVPDHHRPFAQAFRPGGPYVVLAQDFQHLASCKAHYGAGEGEAQDRCRRPHLPDVRLRVYPQVLVLRRRQ